MNAVAELSAAPDDPRYERARREAFDRYYDLAKGKRNWQLTALTLLAANGVLAGALAWIASQSRITPYVVEVDRLGHAVAFGPAERLVDPKERLLTYQLSVFIHHVRTVTTDPELQQHLLDSAYAYARDPATSFLNEHFRATNPFARGRSAAIEARVESILPLGDGLWQVHWTEGSPGQTDRRDGYEAVLKVEVDPPSSTATLLANPLGIYVTEISWTQTL